MTMASTRRDTLPVLNLASRMERNSLSLDEIKRLAASHKIDMEARNRRGRSPLMIACANDDKDMVKFLLDHGADPNARCTTTGNTPMHFATVNSTCGLLISGKTCDFSAPHKKSRINTRKEIIRLLVCHGATLQHNSVGLNPPCMAALHKLNGIVNFFVQGSEHTSSGFQISIAEEVEAFEFLGVALGLSDDIANSFLYLHRAVSLYETIDIPSLRDYERSEMAAHFSLFSTKECKTLNDWEAIEQDSLAVKIQCFLVADRVIPERIKKSYIIPQLLTHGLDGIFASHYHDYSYKEILEEFRDGSQIFREAIEWELQSNLRLGTVFRKILCGIRNHYELQPISRPTNKNKSVIKCYELIGQCSEMFGEVSKQCLTKYSADLALELTFFLEHVALSDYKSKEMFESQFLICERIVGVLQRRCNTSVTHFFLESIVDSVSDISNGRKAKENCVKHMLSRLLQLEDASMIMDGNSMLHSLIKELDSCKAMHFVKDTALILIRNGCNVEARDAFGLTAKETLCQKIFFNQNSPENEELLTLISPPTSVLSLEEIAARTILRHKIPHEGLLPKHLSAIVYGDLEPDLEPIL